MRRGQAAWLPNGEEMWSLWRVAPSTSRPRPHERKGKVVYASMKVALGRRDSVGPSLPLLAALVALVAAIAALLLAYNASPARAADGSCSTNAGTTTCTFASTGSEQTFQVPPGVSSVQVVAIGAPGAQGVDDGSAGKGAQVSGALTGLTPLQTLYVEVGGAPTNTSGVCHPSAACTGGFNGGGSSRTYGGGGGGASDVRSQPRTVPLASNDSRLIVAGGGGGSASGQDCGFGTQPGGAGGDAGADGGTGSACDTIAGGTGGKAGTQSVGGLGGSPDGQDGSLGQGGNSGGLTGGGGGGGYYGGGAGGESVSIDPDAGKAAPGGGGGGGSSLVPAGGSGPTITSDGPSITISYTTPPPPDTTPPTLTVTHTADGSNDWNKTSPVTVNVSASDTGSGLAAEGPTCTDGTAALPLEAGSTADTWKASVSGDGTHNISCKVSDKAGNTATTTDTVKIDTKAPTVSCSVTPSKLRTSANNHKLVTVTASVTVTDTTGGSGTDPISTNRFTLVSVTSDQAPSGLAADDVPNDIQGWTTGTADTSGQLRAERYGGTRTYTLTYQGKDLAGNIAQCKPTVTVPKGG